MMQCHYDPLSAPLAPSHVAKYLVTLLQSNIGLTSSYVKGSSDFTQKARGLEIGANDKLVTVHQGTPTINEGYFSRRYHPVLPSLSYDMLFSIDAFLL